MNEHSAENVAPLWCRLFGHRYWISTQGALARLCVRCGHPRSIPPENGDDQ